MNLKGSWKQMKVPHYLGEVAIVPDNSPVSNTNTIFFDTLLMKIHPVHFAIGREDGEALTILKDGNWAI